MKVNKLQELLSRMRKDNKDRYFVEYCLMYGLTGQPISPTHYHKLEKLMDKKGIKFRPSKLSSFIYRIKLWWWLESPVAKIHMRRHLHDYEGLSKTIYD
jgi:hypothetical protein